MRSRSICCLILSLVGTASIGYAESDSRLEQATAEAIGFLRDLIRINTTNPPGNEKAAAEYIQHVLKSEHIPCRVIEAAPGRANIIGRLKGSGRARPIILMAHIDVVGVEREKWSFDPFGAEVKDGYVLGRGSADDKAMLAANLEIMLLLKRSEKQLERDVIYIGAAGEEGTPEIGINYLLENFPSELEAEFALNEGGDAPLHSLQVRPLYIYGHLNCREDPISDQAEHVWYTWPWSISLSE
jgi:acetylornithine deacetylase/succinyl-diaminopimelate desuccinylase-like protein